MTNEPPHSIEAEQAVLGAVLLESGAWPDVSHLTADDWYRADHRLIWGAVERLATIGAACDALTVADRLDGDGSDVLVRAGGLAYLTDLVNNATGTNIAAYAGIVRERARLRTLVKAGAETVTLARSAGANAGDVADRMRSMLDALPAGDTGSWQAVSLGDLLDEEDAEIPWLVDRLLPAGGTSLLYGGPKSGKSSLAREMAAKIAIGAPWYGRKTDAKGGSVLYVTLDEPRRETPREHFRTLFRELGNHDGAMLRSRIHLLFGPRPAGGVAALRAVIERIEPAPVLVVVDTLMKLEPFEDANDYGASGDAMARVTAIAQATGAHLMLVHHSRKDDSGPPALSVLGSTRIAADVDVLARLKLCVDGPRKLEFVGRDGVDATIEVGHVKGGAGGATDGSELD